MRMFGDDVPKQPGLIARGNFLWIRAGADLGNHEVPRAEGKQDIAVLPIPTTVEVVVRIGPKVQTNYWVIAREPV